MSENKTMSLTIENGIKKFRSENYNYNFRMSDGYFQRWGGTLEEDPEVAPAPEIVDIEISVGSGCPVTCKMCLPAGTTISSIHEDINVEDIKVGNIVSGQNTNDSITKPQEVKEIYKNWFDGNLVVIETENGYVLKLTPNHEVFTRSGWVAAENLLKTDKVVFVREKGFHNIINITKEKFRGFVYNFHCTPDENYFAENILVHNCYKGNTKGTTPRNMSLETFKKLINKLPKFNGIHFTTQVAFGITSIGTHPEIFDIFQYCRDNTIIPNVTINGSDPMTDEEITKLVNVCGACAISVVHPFFDNAYTLIKKITDAGMDQCNIHFVVSKESIKYAYKVCEDIQNDSRLKNLNAIVFLGIKPKERGQKFSVLPNDDYTKLVEYCLDNDIPFGMDSCSVPKFQNSIQYNKSLSKEEKKSILMSVDRCEASSASAYTDVDGIYWHCSFGEGRDDGAGLNVLEANDFLEDIWHHPKLEEWREKMSKIQCECGFYEELHLKNG